MEWTSNKPEVPGFYWWTGLDEAKVVEIMYIASGSPLFVEHHGWLSEMPDGEWAGPIQPPKGV